MKRTLAFISDVHGNINALKSVLRRLDDLGISRTATYSLGDLVGYGPNPNEVLELIQMERITSVLGNHDQKVLDYRAKSEETITPSIWTACEVSEANKAYLRNLEERIVLVVGRRSILLTHGSPASLDEYIYEADDALMRKYAGEEDADVIITGHTHLPYAKTVDGTLFLNPGSVGRPKDGNWYTGFCVLTLEKDELSTAFYRVPYDAETMADRIRETALPDAYADVLLTGIA